MAESSINTTNGSSRHTLETIQDDAQHSTTAHHGPTEHNVRAFNQNADVLIQPTPQHPSNITVPTFHLRKPSSQGLHLHTELANKIANIQAEARSQRSSMDSTRAHLQLSPTVSRRPSLTSRRSLDDFSGAFSPPSTMSSPAFGPLTDVTPLPSPLYRSNSPELWRRLLGRRRGSSASSINPETLEALPAPALLHMSPSKKKKSYSNLGSPALRALHDHEIGRAKSRSISEFVPEPLTNVRPRNVTEPGSASAAAEAARQATGPAQSQNSVTPTSAQSMHREDFLAGQKRKHVVPNDPATMLPSPPPSNKSTADSDEGDDRRGGTHDIRKVIRVHPRDGEVQRWRPLRELGQGAFSQVFLAARDDQFNPHDPDAEKHLEPHQLVAVKVITHDKSMPVGDEARMETSIGREIEILESISHPCLPQLLAFDDSHKRSVLVLDYCPGGDLFELASQKREFLTPDLIQRIFAELIEAVGYLHSQWICHRDIKLENVLFDQPLTELPNLAHPQAYPRALVTLTDLGLAKRIPRPPESAMLVHNCGSIDYAAPELLLQQPYDGRSTDIWALGVTLYALMEGRLPFDPLPGKRRQGNINHRIARCDWVWVEHGDEDGEWDDSKGKELSGAHEVVEGMLKKVTRGRWNLRQLSEHAWVKEGILTSGRVLLPGTASPKQEF